MSATPHAVREALSRFAAGEPVVTKAPALAAYLRELAPQPLLPLDAETVVLDLEAGSMMLGEPLSGLSVERFTRLIARHMRASGTDFALGRWGERRDVYRADFFAAENGEAMREVHLGVDVFCAAGTAIRAPLAGRVHTRVTNDRELDYGPLLILEHEGPAGVPFYSLYGHLAGTSTAGWNPGDRVAAGQQVATVGMPPENGNWPPHLHFQLILDLLGLGADFPGVALHAEQDAWLELSPLPSSFFPRRFAAALDARRGF